jgi:hypothetical protein
MPSSNEQEFQFLLIFLNTYFQVFFFLTELVLMGVCVLSWLLLDSVFLGTLHLSTEMVYGAHFCILPDPCPLRCWDFLFGVLFWTAE